MQVSFLQANSGNFRAAKRGTGDIKYLVIHFTANDGDTAKNNADYFARSNISTSAHYFVDRQEVWQSVRDADIAWHCGTRGTYYHPYCRNANSIGIEMCSYLKNGVYEIAAQTVDNTVALARQLMQRYNIPRANVVRHYDVTHKSCPEPFVRDSARWAQFLSRLEEDDMTEAQVNQLIASSKCVYKMLADVPDWGQDTVVKLVTRGLLKGDGGALNLSEDMLRVLVVNDRAGLYGA